MSQSERARAWIRAALGHSWEVREAGEGRAAMAIAREEPLDLVVADETTVPYGAFGLARELKILPDPPRVIVLLERAQDVWLATWSGADGWLVQPVDPFALASTARELVGARAAASRGEGT